MKRLVFWIGGGVLLLGGSAGGYLAVLPSVAAEGTTFGETDLSGMTRDQIVRRLEAFWQMEKGERVEMHSHLLKEQPEPMTLEQLGIRPDWDATLAAVHFESGFDKAKTFMSGDSTRGSNIEIIWRIESAQLEDLEEFVKTNARAKQSARVLYQDGQIVRKYEVSSFRLDPARIGDAAIASLRDGARKFELPVIMDDVTIPKAELDKIVEVVSEFTTKFNQGQYNRSSNIRLSTQKLDGVVLMPGEVLSYNEVVGKRLVSEGFRLAGIYANGRREQGIGGGICQVSSTLFNVALLANLEIVEHRNHSMPVPYLPVGRDATVDYGTIDLKIRNSTDAPIAIVGETVGGTVTFRVLGKKDPGLEVAIITTDHSSWSNQVRYVDDATLAPGANKIVEPGSTGRRCTTWRILRRDGKEIAREKISVNTYQAFPRIVARGPAPAEATARIADPEDVPSMDGGW